MKQYIISILFALCMMACTQHSKHWETICQVESYIEEQPDSALVVLQGIDVSELSNDEERAKHALLLSMAYDMNDISQTDDSLISTAKAYYEHSDNVKYQFLSYYYYGRVLCNRGDFPQAIVLFTQAEELINQLDNSQLAGQLYMQIGDIYCNHYDYAKCLEAYELAYDYFMKANDKSQAVHALINIGKSHWGADNHQEGIKYTHMALDKAISLDDDTLKQQCYSNLVIMYDNLWDADKCGEYVDILLTQYDIEQLSPKCLASIASHYAQLEDINNAGEFLNRARMAVSNETDAIDYYFKSAYVMKSINEYALALQNIESGINIQQVHLRDAMQQPIVSAQKEYFQDQAAQKADRLKRERKLYITISAIVVLIIIAVALYIRHKIATKNSEINRYMEAMQELEQSLLTKDMAADSMATKINTLFASQFSLIDKLTNTYYETHGTKRDKEAIYTQVRNEIEKLQTNKRYIQELEAIVNKHKESVMQILRESMPEFSEMDFRLLCFIYAGFSAKAISVFTADSIGNIYMRKSRLKARISNSNAEKKELILKYLR